MTRSTPANRVASHLPSPLSEVDALLSHFFPSAVGARMARVGWVAPASVWEADDRFYVELDAPGVKPDGVEVTFEKGQLTLSVERAAPQTLTPDADKPEVGYVYNERRFGKVTRTLTLPETVDPESISAELTSGVLRVSIAKLPEAQPRRIEVKLG